MMQEQKLTIQIKLSELKNDNLIENIETRFVNKFTNSNKNMELGILQTTLNAKIAYLKELLEKYGIFRTKSDGNLKKIYFNKGIDFENIIKKQCENIITIAEINESLKAINEMCSEIKDYKIQEYEEMLVMIEEIINTIPKTDPLYKMDFILFEIPASEGVATGLLSSVAAAFLAVIIKLMSEAREK